MNITFNPAQKQYTGNMQKPAQKPVFKTLNQDTISFSGLFSKVPPKEIFETYLKSATKGDLDLIVQEAQSLKGLTQEEFNSCAGLIQKAFKNGCVIDGDADALTQAIGIIKKNNGLK